MSALQKKLFYSQGLPPKPPGPRVSRLHAKQKRDYSCASWTDYFSKEEGIQAEGSKDIFHCYKRGDKGPFVIFLHGGGFSGLSWALLAKALTALIHCECIAVDQRGHGRTITDDDYRLSAEQLASDIENIVYTIINKEESESLRSVVLVGHSMGGAVAVHAAVRDKVPNLVGLVLIDVVEGSAMESLHSMRGVLQNRPKSFESMEKAIEWCVRTGYVRNLESAKVSMGGQLIKLDTAPADKATDSQEHSKQSSLISAIQEEEENDSETNQTFLAETSQRDKASTSDNDVHSYHKIQGSYTWRIDLSRTAEFWEGWFKGMSDMFLSTSVPKLLMLAGIDRLDTKLTAAQMQGKFQMHVLSKSGHAVHEDVPDKVAESIAHFLVRNKIAEAAADFTVSCLLTRTMRFSCNYYSQYCCPGSSGGFVTRDLLGL